MHGGALGVLYGLYSIEEWFPFSEKNRPGQRIFAIATPIISGTWTSGRTNGAVYIVIKPSSFAFTIRT